MTVPMVLALAVAGTAAVPAMASAATGSAAVADCSNDWGSLSKSDRSYPSAQLANIRTGQNGCYDRLVFDIPGASEANRLGYHVNYVDVLRQDASGTPIPVKGGAILEVVVTAHTFDWTTGKYTYRASAGDALPGVDLTGYRTFVDARFAGSNEGYTQIGLGVRAKLPFRVFQLDNRLVVDVAHTWGTAG
ncbi:hypothetical protein ACFC1R_24360 [Kitasatospora sp. NPDC056138]|uniref:AMIN-like domain-containing (lipo)protein n=1 Tax=Kitasatospora sp. NPDC056138 TaxID=3345724 RepID=UPI0035D55671